MESNIDAFPNGDCGRGEGRAISCDQEAAFSVGKSLRLGRGRGWGGCSGVWRRLWRLCCRRWGRLVCLPPCNLRPEWESSRVNRLGSLGVCRCRNSSCLRCCRLRCGGGGNVGGLYSLKVANAVLSSSAIWFQPGVVDFCCLSPSEVLVLDFREEASNGCDKGLHGEDFLCSCRRGEAPNPVGRDGFLVREEVESRETWELGGVAVRTFGCWGVPCRKDAASSCPRGHGGSAGSKQQGCRSPRLNHNRWPGASCHGEWVRGGLSQCLKEVRRGVEGGVFLSLEDIVVGENILP